MNFEESSDRVALNPPSSELAIEYQKLLKIYQEQKNEIDRYKQQIYTLNKEKNLKDNLLQDELEHIKESFESELDKANKKNAMEIRQLQNRLTATNSMLDEWKLENEQLKSELDAAKNDLHAKNSAPVAICNQNDMIVSKKRMEFLEKNEVDCVELQNDIAQLVLEKSELSSKVSQLMVEFEEIKEYYDCSRQNLEQKTDELNEAQNIIESMHEKMVEIENELLSYKNSNLDHNKKGNSLFAEVDDQRQQMKDHLNRQNQQYQSMKMKYEQSASEINRLKLENADLINEVKECVNMFKSSDKFEKTKLREYIGFLKTENNRLDKELKVIQAEMDSLAKTHGINWVSSMFEFCENKTKELLLKLDSYGMKKCEAEGLCAQAQERAAKWRFEALKSRCIIINREMLLEKHKVQFESKFPNIRQMVEKQFNDNENPIIDDTLSILCTDRSNGINSESSEIKSNDNSWEEVKDIFVGLENKTEVPAHRDDDTMLPFELKSHEQLETSNPTTPFAENIVVKSVDNKENVNANLTAKVFSSSSLNSIKQKSFEVENICPSNTIENTVPPMDKSILRIGPNNHATQTTPAYDAQNRGRQVKVEMFTVTLKPKKN